MKLMAFNRRGQGKRHDRKLKYCVSRVLKRSENVPYANHSRKQLIHINKILSLIELGRA